MTTTHDTLPGPTRTLTPVEAEVLMQATDAGERLERLRRAAQVLLRLEATDVASVDAQIRSALTRGGKDGALLREALALDLDAAGVILFDQTLDDFANDLLAFGQTGW